MAIGNADTDANGKGQGQNGHGVLTRQITGVAAGTDLTDAVNVAQLQAAIAQFSGGESGTSGDGVHYYSVRSNEKGSDSNYDNKGAKGQNSLAAGVRASTTENAENAVAIGYGAKAEGKGATVIGQYGKATGRYALAFGGQQTDTTAEQADNVASGDNALSFGERTTASGANATAFGQETQASEKRATAFGQRTKATQSNATAFGVDTTASGMNATAFGNLTQATAIGATAFGNKNKATGQYATAWGGGDKTVDNGDGTTSKIGTVASGTYATAFGERTAASGESATAFGSDSTASGKNALAFGENSTAAGENSVAALGGTTAQNAANAAAIGKDAQAKLADSVALGSGSVADRQSGTKGYDAATGAESTQTSATWVANANAIAVGNGSTLTRQITGVAAGSQDTDAVNLAQLKEVGNLAGKHTTVSVGGQEATADGTLVKGGNLELNRKTADGQANYDVALSKDVVLGEQEEHKGGSLVVNSVAQFRTAPGSKDTYPVKEAVKIDGTTVSVVKNDGTNDQRQVVLGVGQDVGGYVALFEKTGKTPTYIFNAISSGITYLKDGKEFNRLEYGDITNGSTQFIATLDDGLKFSGDQGTDSAVKLNQKLTVTGGETNPDNLANANNIGVVSSQDRENGKLEIRLAKDLKGLTSVQTGDTTVDSNGLKIEKAGKDSKDSITINKTTVSIAGNQITNMGSGIDGTKYTDAGDNNGANIGDVKKLADSRKTTVKSTDGSVKVTNTSTDSNHFDYDLSVDTTKVAGAVDLKYKGDNNTQGSNKLSEAVTFSGTEDQIVTQAEDGKVTFRLADDVTTQTITAVGQNGNDGQIGLTGKNGANGSVTTIIKTVGAKGTDGKDGIPGVDGQPGKDGITRLIYDETDDKGGTEHHVVATLDDGLKFVGNDGKVVTRKLNDTLSIKGGIENKEMLADAQRVSSRNLGVRQNTAKDGLEIVMTNRPDFEAITVGPDSNPAHKITIGQQDNQAGNPNPTKGNYITGLDNTQWDAGHVVADRAATEGQLSQAITDISGKEKGGFGLADEKGGTVKKELGGTIAVKGDGTNIETKVNGDALEVSLKKDVDLTKDGSIKAGNTTINGDGVETNKVKVGDITITDQGINGGTKQITNIASGIDGKQYADAKDNNAASIGDVKQIAGEEAGKAAEAVKSKSGKNITVKDDHTVNLNDNITLGDETDASKQVVIDGNGAKVTAGDGANKVTVDGSKGQVTIGSGDKTLTLGKQANTAGDSNPAEGNYLNGLDNTKWDGEHIQSGRAATEDQLKTVSDKVNSGRVFQGDDGKEVKVGMGDTLKIQGGVKAEDVSRENNIGIVKGADDTLNIRLAKDIKGLDSVTTGNTTIDNGGLTVKTGDSSHQDITIKQGNVNMGGNKIEGVAPGKVSKDSTDAVNGSQLWQRDQAINGLSGSVNKLGNRINRVGAGAAALAALHPLDFDPDDKWDFAAGYGNYRGANAAAVGAYYRPNEDTMFSVGGSFGGGENMVNAGVSIKLGQGNHVSTSRVAMAKEMKAMRQHMAEQDALIAKLQSMHGMAVDPAKSTLFPDVAENHWAYQYVTTLAKKGILEGYPDGEFKGDRMMTRYEFAAIVYRIVESGVGSTDPELSKLVKEFSPELQYIRIDTIQKDRDGKPTIERVRVISDAK